ncbi:MAG: DNA replication/repair protein RecF [Clostridiales bacterium]|jgi:DNA replication and repair protein RecF|nr:DNA replication/repair protein RecF [Clostridiales bacterium]
MRLHTISFKDFRNLEDNVCSLGPNVNVIFGENAQGKTNFLEAAYLCATGRSQRAAPDREMIRFEADEAHVQAMIAEDHAAADQIDIHLRKAGKKSAAVNHEPVRRLGDLFGHLLTVVFSPEGLQLIKAGPGERRHFLDMELCQINPVYYYELRQYYQILKQRNHLLKLIQQKTEDRESLSVWDRQMADHGRRISVYRREFVERLNPLAASMHSRITGGKEVLSVSYRPNVKGDDFEERLRRGWDRDIALGGASVGVHRDDLVFMIGLTDARVYGSQGQQRTAALAAKLAEVSLIREYKGCDPVLLLDDVLSELDQSRQRFLLDSAGGIQTIITCTGAEDVIKQLPADTAVLRMAGGRLRT